MTRARAVGAYVTVWCALLAVDGLAVVADGGLRRLRYRAAMRLLGMRHR